MENIHKPVRLLIDEYSECIFKDIIKQINKNKKCIELICLNEEKFNNLHLDDLDVDIVWMTETIHQTPPIMLYDLILRKKFKEWYFNEEPFQSFYKTFQFEHFQLFEEEARRYLKDIEDIYYYSNVLINEKRIVYTSAILHIDINQYGFIDFGSAVLK